MNHDFLQNVSSCNVSCLGTKLRNHRFAMHAGCSINMRKDALLEFEYFPFIGSLYNRKLSPAPFEFQFFAVSPPRSRINRSVCNERRVGRIDGYSHICFSIRLYVYFALKWPGRSQYKPCVSLFTFTDKVPKNVIRFLQRCLPSDRLDFAVFLGIRDLFLHLRESYSKLSLPLSISLFFFYRNVSICVRREIVERQMHARSIDLLIYFINSLFLVHDKIQRLDRFKAHTS